MNFLHKILIILVIIAATLAIKSCKTPDPVFQSKSTNGIKIDTLHDSARLTDFRDDTIGYLNYLIQNQEKYRGKPLKSFLNDLELKIQRFTFWPNLKDRRIIYNVELSANEIGHPTVVGNNGERIYLQIGVRWKTFIPYDSIKIIFDYNGPPDKGRWGKKAEDYFGKQLVGNLWINDNLKRN